MKKLESFQGVCFNLHLTLVPATFLLSSRFSLPFYPLEGKKQSAD